MFSRHFGFQYDREFIKTKWFPLPFLLLFIPFVNFIISNSYPIFSPEVFLAAGSFLVAGLLLGFIGHFHRMVRAFIVAGAVTLFVDVQTQVFSVYSWHQYVWLPIVFWAIAYVLLDKLEALFLGMASLMLLIVLLTPGGKLFKEIESRAADLPSGAAQDTNTPDEYWIHIIADELIGLEAIPAEFDSGRRLTTRVRNDYVDDGFVVFGRAFTRFAQTHLSLSNLFNFSAQHPVLYLSDDPSTTGMTLKENAYLSRLLSRGSEVQVYQSDYFRICESPVKPGMSCKTYGGNTISGVYGTSLSTVDKSLLILRVYARLSKILDRTLTDYSIDQKLSLPRSISSLVGLKTFGRFEADILESQSSSAWVIHFVLPHYPYAFDSQCKIREFPWQDGGGDSESYVRNSEEARSRKYPLYLEQVDCTHRVFQSFFDSLMDAGIYDKAHIVIHGDHGSRIATHNLKQRDVYDEEFVPSPNTLVDYFGTFFAYKPPNSAAGMYRREMMSIANLLNMVSGGQLEEGITDEVEPHVFLVEWDSECSSSDDIGNPGCRLLEMQLPRFSASGL